MLGLSSNARRRLALAVVRVVFQADTDVTARQDTYCREWQSMATESRHIEFSAIGEILDQGLGSVRARCRRLPLPNIGSMQGGSSRTSPTMAASLGILPEYHAFLLRCRVHCPVGFQYCKEGHCSVRLQALNKFLESALIVIRLADTSARLKELHSQWISYLFYYISYTMKCNKMITRCILSEIYFFGNVGNSGRFNFHERVNTTRRS